MFKILDGREYFYQWDLNQKLIVEDDSINEVHFSNRTDGCSLVVEVDELRQASVPNILLQDYWDIRVYAYCSSGESKYTKVEEKFEVKKRSKPSDYIYTEEENKIWDNKVDIFQGKENSKKILSTDENGKVVTEISVDEILTNKDIPLPTSADNGKYLGCENGAAVWLPVEAPGGGDISLGLTAASVGQTIKVKAVDENGKPTEWEAVDMLSGGGHWETVLDTVWEQDVINPTAFDSETGIFTCASGELDNLALDTEYVFFQQCVKEGVAYNTILGNEALSVTKLSETTFSIDATPPTTFVPTNVKFSRGTCLVVTDIDAKKIRLTLDGQFNPTATAYNKPFFGTKVPYFGAHTGYTQIRNAYHAYQQVTAEVESPYRIVGEILCGFNAPSNNASYHFKNNSFCCPLVPYDVPKGHERTYFLTSDGTKIAKLYSNSVPWHLGGISENAAIAGDYLKIISGTKVKLERWVE